MSARTADDQRTREITPSEAEKADRQERGSPQRAERRRSRSPRRDRVEDRPRRKDAGFKWKEKRRDDDEDGRRKNDKDTGLQRGYKDQYRPRSWSPRRVEKEDEVKQPSAEKKERKEKKEKKAASTGPAEPMIIVYVNDRLGTKKAIPCFASDPIKDFKVIVASQIGRQPHEILLKRQGERPFKDQLTLRDYGVSNNVQLDLEVDTGD